MIIKYKSIIIDGRDRSGQVEDLPDVLALRLIKQGYAELVAAPSIQPQDPVDDKPKKRNRPWA